MNLLIKQSNIIFLLFSVFTISCSDNMTTDEYVENSSNALLIPESIDFGTMTIEEIKTLTFDIENKSNKIVEIENIKSSNGSIIPSYDSTALYPHDKLTVTVMVEARSQGNFIKTLKILSDEDIVYIVKVHLAVE